MGDHQDVNCKWREGLVGGHKMTCRPSNSEHVPHAHVCCHPKEVLEGALLHCRFRWIWSSQNGVYIYGLLFY